MDLLSFEFIGIGLWSNNFSHFLPEGPENEKPTAKANSSHHFFYPYHRSYREAVLDMFVFQSLNEVREQTEKWLKDYNEERPHDALGDMTPREYLLTNKPEVSTYEWT